MSTLIFRIYISITMNENLAKIYVKSHSRVVQRSASVTILGIRISTGSDEELGNVCMTPSGCGVQRGILVVFAYPVSATMGVHTSAGGNEELDNVCVTSSGCVVQRSRPAFCEVHIGTSSDEGLENHCFTFLGCISQCGHL